MTASEFAAENFAERYLDAVDQARTGRGTRPMSEATRSAQHRLLTLAFVEGACWHGQHEEPVPFRRPDAEDASLSARERNPNLR